MINLIFTMFVLLIMVLPVVGQETKKQPVAVNDLRPQGLESSSAAIITERLRNELFNTGVYTVLERSRMDDILKEQGFQKSGACTDEACAVEIGRLLSVRYMVTGTIGKIGRTYTLNVRMIDVESGEITSTADVDCKCEIDDVLSVSTKEIANKLAGRSPASPPAAVIHKDKAVAGETMSGVQGLAPAPRKRRTGLKIAFGSGAVLGLAAGIVCNAKVRTEGNNAERVQNWYDASGSDVDYDKYKKEYSSSYGNAKQALLLRNAAYGLSAVLASGFVVSLRF